MGGVLHHRAKDVKLRRGIGLRHDGVIQIAQQHAQGIAGGEVLEFRGSGMGGARLDKNAPAGLAGDVLQQRPERLAMNIRVHPVGRVMPHERISVRRARGQAKPGGQQTEDEARFLHG